MVPETSWDWPRTLSPIYNELWAYITHLSALASEIVQSQLIGQESRVTFRSCHRGKCLYIGCAMYIDVLSLLSLHLQEDRVDIIYRF